MNYKVVIPTAGLGSRLKSLSKYVNKALVTIANKPSISYIIEKFPENIEIVIPLGYKKETVKDYLTIAYPKRKFSFVEVFPFEGEGSGLGYTLLQCKDLLQIPFIFCSNDTIVTDEIPLPDQNWMGYADITETEQYRSIRFEKYSQVVEICSKGASGNVKPYIGLAGIYDYEIFWKSMEEGKADGAINVGESYGLRYLIEKEIRPIKFNWFDTGNLESLQKSRAHFQQEEEPNILDKEEEAIWFVDNKVVKFATDKEFIANRVKRVQYLGSYVPELITHSENMYAYLKVEGEIFSQNPNLPSFKYFLDWMDGFWEKKILDENGTVDFKNRCGVFYKDKTYKRVKQYFTRFEQIDSEEIINGSHVPKLMDLLNKVDWAYVADGIPVRFHGDLHFENILIKNDGMPPFVLLDWRQDFAGILEYGDIYYDFAKLLHGIIISHELIHNDQYTVNHRMNNISYDFHRKHSLVECEDALRQYLIRKQYDVHKVDLLTALVFLNIAPLHHYPYTSLLFYLGKSMLFECLKAKE
jgi:NDP-sugar pyrophosphorylase family protein